METRHFRRASNKRTLFQIILVVMDGLFGRSPAGFKLDEALVFGLGPSKTETLIAVLRVPLDGLPHDEVVCPELLEFLV